MPQPRLFVIMPFGKRKHGDVALNFDLIYADLVRPAGQESGFAVLRIDEVLLAGSIADQYLRELFLADLAIADVSIPNGNVFYELGVRQAISSGATILIAQEGSELPFDIAHQRVFWYRAATVEQLKESRHALGEVIRNQVIADNPVRRFLEGIGFTSSPETDAAEFEKELQGRIQRANTTDQLVAVWKWAENIKPLPALPLLSLAEKLGERECWKVSVQVLDTAAAVRPRDFEIHRQLGFHLRHVGDDARAQKAFETALELNPNDPETLGMLGGLLKRQGYFEDARRHYDHGAELVPDNPYIRVNQAALAVLLSPEEPAAGIELYTKLLADIEGDPSSPADVWAQLIGGEAAFATGREDAWVFFERAQKLATTRKPLRSAAEQLELFASVGFRVEEARRMAKRLGESGEVTSTSTLPPGAKSTASLTDATLSVVETAPSLPVIIHLSDPHFGTISKDGKVIEMHRFYDGDYSRTLSKNLKEEFKAKRAYFHYDPTRLLLVISGDLTYRAEEDEFGRAETFLREVCHDLEIPLERVILVPGNHDVHWPSIDVKKSLRFDNFLTFLLSFYGEDLFRRRYPLVKWDFKVNTPRPGPEEIVAFYDEAVTIVGMNSCVYETNQDHYGFIGGRQLRAVEGLLSAENSKTRIAVFHHHLHPFPEPLPNPGEAQPGLDMSTLRDAGHVERVLERLEFDLVLHGHKHKPQLRETVVRGRNERDVRRMPLIVCGGGSVGVNSRELEHNVSNQYGLIEFLRPKRVSGASFLRLEWRELSLEAAAEWATSEQWTVVG